LALPVQGPGADLDVDGVALRTDRRRVQRLVHGHLRPCDEVLEPPRHRLPQRVDAAERTVAVADGARDHADGREVVDLVELAALVVHLLPDGVEVLWPPADLRLDSYLRELP